MTFDLFEHPIYLDTPQRVTHSAWTQHVPFGMLLVDLTRPHTLVELGAHTGMSYCAFCQAVEALHLETRCYAVDTWEGDEQAGFYGEDILSDLRAHHDPRYGGFSTLLRMTFDDAASQFADHSIDLLHIDGFHTYEAVKHDFDTWLPRMSERGVVVLHDIAERAGAFGVWRLWDELIATYPAHLEFPHGHGLGVVAVGSDVPQGLQALLDQPADRWQATRATLSKLGAQIDESYLLGATRRQLEQEREEREQEREEREQEREQERAQERAQRTHAEAERAALTQAHQQALAESQRQLAATQRLLNTTAWNLTSLESSRAVRIVKLARASRHLLREQGSMQLVKRIALWSAGQRGYGMRQEHTQEPHVVKAPRPSEREDKQIIFLSGRPGGAMRYRCDHQAETLRLLGCAAESTDMSEVELEDILPRFQAFVLHRVAMTKEVGAFITEARKLGKPVFFETDDLVFLPDLAKHLAALELMSSDERARYLKEMAGIRETLLRCDASTVSTAALCEWVKPLQPLVGITPNAVTVEMVERSDSALAGRGASADAPVTIAYFSGSYTHDRDFVEAQDAVLWALQTYPQTELLVAGPLTLDAQFDRFGARIRREPFRSWQELPALYATVAINLAPLERDNPFTEAKSCVKYLEAGLVGVPTIASARQDFVRVIESGVNGLLADSPDEWRGALRQLIESAAARREMGERAAADVRAHHTTTAQAPTVTATYRDLYRATARPAAAPLRVTWVLDAAERNCPSFQMACRLAEGLAASGHPTRICVWRSPGQEPDADIAPAPGTIAYTMIGDVAELPPSDITIATNPATATLLARHHETRFRFHLAQNDAMRDETAFMNSLTEPLRLIACDDAVARCAQMISGITPERITLGSEGEILPATVEHLEAVLLAHWW